MTRTSCSLDHGDPAQDDKEQAMLWKWPYYSISAWRESSPFRTLIHLSTEAFIASYPRWNRDRLPFDIWRRSRRWR